MAYQSRAPPNRTNTLRSSFRPYIPITALAVAFVAWSVFWKIAAGATDAAITEWFAQEKLAGRNWTCGDRQLGGYPFRIELRCARPTFSGQVAGVRVEGSVGDILAAANVYDPALIVADVASPLALRASPDRGQIDLDWSQLRISYRAADNGPQLVSLALTAPKLRALAPRLDDFLATAAKIEAHARPTPARPNAFDVTVSASGVSAPLVDRVIGETSPLDFNLASTVSRLDALGQSGGGSPLDRWRRAGGQARIDEFHIGKGALDLLASGTLDIDEAHRPRGKLDTAAAGLGAVMDRFGLPTAALAIGNLLGGPAAAPPVAGAAPKPGALNIRLTLANGRAMVGPVALPFALAPLY